MLNFVFGLCKGRHELPCEVFLFNGEISPLNVLWLEKIARYSLQCEAHRTETCVWNIRFNGEYDEAFFDFPEEATVTIYVTGLTVALIAVLNVLRSYKASVVLMHYDRETNTYYEQKVV